MTMPFPFSAVVGNDDLKRALLLRLHVLLVARRHTLCMHPPLRPSKVRCQRGEVAVQLLHILIGCARAVGLPATSGKALLVRAQQLPGKYGGRWRDIIVELS